MFLFIRFATQSQAAAVTFSGKAQAVVVDQDADPELDGLNPTQRQALYEAVVQEMIRVCTIHCRTDSKSNKRTSDLFVTRHLVNCLYETQTVYICTRAATVAPGNRTSPFGRLWNIA